MQEPVALESSSNSFVVLQDAVEISHHVPKMGSDFAYLHQDLADSTSGSLAASIDPQVGPKGESVKGRESPIVSIEDEGPPIRAVCKLENHATSADSFILDSHMQTDVLEGLLSEWALLFCLCCICLMLLDPCGGMHWRNVVAANGLPESGWVRLSNAIEVGAAGFTFDSLVWSMMHLNDDSVDWALLHWLCCICLMLLGPSGGLPW
ncbi:hypothetical protein Nepgr_016487 [Nepenthes gracilis]|uniref:Uncharacterized protein n=1 Tax=Nepenthes gracilis TaxID=150966 RepID=A0AAD3SQM7_NEPGR|nr:hypothetical protein Nepgr_016487 [Nepenthes gracilis]